MGEVKLRKMWGNSAAPSFKGAHREEELHKCTTDKVGGY